MIKLLLGGSPCTYWSIAQKNYRETEPSGQGWELFKNYLIAREKFKPDYFLYENNYSMDNKIRDEITKNLGVEPIMINSALVSAQSRKRYYWTNIPGVCQPADKGILLKDVIDSGIDLSGNEKSYCLTATYDGACAQNTIERKQRTMIAELTILQRGYGFNKGGVKYKKSPTMTVKRAFCHNNKVIEPLCIAQRGRYSDSGNRIKKGNGAVEQYYEVRNDGKTNTLATVQKDNAVVEPIRIGTIENNSQNKEFDSKQYRVYSPFSKSTTLCAGGGGAGAKTGLYAIPFAQSNNNKYRIYEVVSGNITVDNKTYPIKLLDGYYIIRKLTVTECKRLQTIPDWYKMPCSASQNYKMLGNGWTVDVISHILSFVPNLQSESFEVLSMYDGMSCGQISLKNLGVNVTKYFATEIDKFAIKTTMFNFPGTIYLGDAFNVRKSDFEIAQPKIKREPIKMVSGVQMTLF